MYTVRDMHKSTISCLDWSQNAARLFSGDVEGNVVCTEIDYTTVSNRLFIGDVVGNVCAEKAMEFAQNYPTKL